MNEKIIEDVRKKQPLIHHLTNQVVMNFTANGLLSFGGSPVMAKADEEAYQMASVANAVVINIGTLTATDLQAMIAAGKAANDKGIPVVLDPVGVAATPFRSSAVNQILENVTCTVIKGNAGELAHLAGIYWEVKGVDAIRGEGNQAEIAKKVAQTFETATVITGKTDYFCVDEEIMQNESGHPLLAKITGSGCLLGSIIAACLTTPYNLKEQLQTALEFYGKAASFAASHSLIQGSGTFLPHFIDALSYKVSDLERSANNEI
ncbi:hydroxyethylthiazole kinase [Virgibacillus sp. 179-BFC.A HS]|uniref:Hydroxyethylthiazole kinase n=1 Tax=Tigheibacillus jepli TaxID=3035914 RepID=A0ABU5CIF3_9BACI|nr:hydroxyethylthiazole kinase [Virgibacillus sp. 179-BFC.A HS]MDY0406113.1 hydroxyethylthiazole kinase [Virgibacillus sp. 179-BFC.A HS]